MAGATEPYDHLPFFYSDLFDLGYEAVGELDSRLNTLSDVNELSAKGTIYYLDSEHRPRGILL
jgi:3-phenylpropionate/trans-cinnamate dioxygenase ferredoxin reductase component